MKQKLLLLLLPLYCCTVVAQISGPATGFTGTPVTFTSDAPGAYFTWSVNNGGTVVNVATATAAATSRATITGTGNHGCMVNDQGNWYGFIPSMNGNLFRISYGSDPVTGTPTVLNMGNLGSFPTNGAIAIDVVLDSATGNWHGFIIPAWAHYDNTSGGNTVFRVTRLDFGNSLANNPSVVKLNPVFGPKDGTEWVQQISVIKHGGNWMIFSAQRGGQMFRYDLGASVLNTVPQVAELPVTPNPVGATPYFSLYQQQGEWHMLCVGLSSGRMTRFAFGTDLRNNQPVQTDITTALGTGTNRGITILPGCNGQLYAYLTYEGNVMRQLDFSGDITNLTPAVTSVSLTGAATTGNQAWAPYVFNDVLYFMNTSNASVYNTRLLSYPAGTVTRHYTPGMTHTFLSPGTYEVNLLVDHGARTGSSAWCKQISISAGLPQPGPFLDSATAVCQGRQGVRYVIPPVSGATGYQWTYSGNGVTVFGSNDTAWLDFSSTATTGTLSVAATNGSGVSVPRTISVTVDVPPAVTVTPQGSQAICQNDTLLLQASAPGRIRYEWSNGSSVIPGGSSCRVTAPGYYSVTVTDSATGCSSVSGPDVEVTVNPLPAVTLSPSGVQSACQGDSLEMTASGSGNVQYVWRAGNVILPASGPVYHATATGSYTVQVSDITTGCRSVSAATGVTIHPLPVAAVHVQGATDICRGDSVLLHATTGPGYHYEWKNNGTLSGTDTIYVVKTGGDYKLFVTDGTTNCTDSTQPVPVQLHELPVVMLTPADTFLCDGSETMLLVVTADTGLTYQWKNGTMPVSQATADFLVVRTAGAYMVEGGRMHVAHCTYTTNAVPVTVYPLPQPVITWDGALLHATSGYEMYQWYRDGQAVGGAINNTYQPFIPGGYVVLVTDSNGCSKASDLLKVEQLAVHDISRSGNNIQIAPNPSAGIVRISAAFTVHVKLISPEGRILFRQEDAREIDLSSFAAGMYLLQITDSKGLVLRNERLIRKN